jgi:hypothetical protein
MVSGNIIDSVSVTHEMTHEMQLLRPAYTILLNVQSSTIALFGTMHMHNPINF